MRLDIWTLLLGGGGLGGLAALLTVYAMRKRDSSADQQGRFAQNLELSRYINQIVSEATAPLVTRIAALEAREDSTKTIVRRFFQRLVFWDSHGRTGPMPMPSPSDMRDLEIEDLEPE